MNYNFKKEKEYLLNFINQVNIVSSEKVEKLQKQYSMIPKDYLNYLKFIGSGSLKNSLIMIYDDLLDFDDIGLEEIYVLPKNIKLFGDNFSGDFIGFDFDKEGEVIEFLHESGEIYWTGKKFKKYIIDVINQ